MVVSAQQQQRAEEWCARGCMFRPAKRVAGPESPPPTGRASRRVVAAGIAGGQRANTLVGTTTPASPILFPCASPPTQTRLRHPRPRRSASCLEPESGPRRRCRTMKRDDDDDDDNHDATITTTPTSQPSSTSPAAPSAAHGHAPARKKQKRNKPTLSCEECVERKTKVSPRQPRPSLRRNSPPSPPHGRCKQTTSTSTSTSTSTRPHSHLPTFPLSRFHPSS